MIAIKFKRRCLFFFVIWLIGMIQIPLRSWGVDWVVDSFMDEADLDQADGICQTSSGACTLRAAIQEANFSLGDDLIILSEGTYILDLQPSNWEKFKYGDDAGFWASNDLDIDNDYSSMTIRGAEQEKTIINAQGVNAAFEVHPWGELQLEDLSIVGGVGRSMNFAKTIIRRCRIADHSNGALHNGGELTIIESTIDHNTADSYGGAIWNLKKLSINGSVISDNSAADWGGGIYHGSPTSILGEITYAIELDIHDSRIISNRAGEGGGIYIGNPISEVGTPILETGEIEATEITGNFADSAGGGIYIAGAVVKDGIGPSNGAAMDNPKLFLRQSVIRDNSAGAYGGGVSVGSYWGVSGDVNIDQSAIVGNSAAEDGGGIFNAGTLTLVNSTVSANSIPDSVGNGSGVSNAGTASIMGSTIAYNVSNKAGGGVAHGGEALSIGHTIIAMNTALGKAADFTGSWKSGASESAGHNVVGATSSAFFTHPSDIVGTLAVPVETFILPLRDLGHAALFHPLGAGSPAINAGATDACPAIDQIDQVRVGTCDVGAFESLCGNGIVDANETCDDANEVDDDECTRACALPKGDQIDESEEIDGVESDGTDSAS